MAGTLPARTELVATWRPTTGEALPEGPLHPAMVALFDAIADGQVELHGTEVRQRVLGNDEDNYSVQISVSVQARGGGRPDVQRSAEHVE